MLEFLVGGATVMISMLLGAAIGMAKKGKDE